MTITTQQRDSLNKSGVGALQREEIGSLIHRGFKVAKGWYKFSRDGGAEGDITLKEVDGVTDCKIPTGALITNCIIRVPVALTSGGSATIAVNTEDAADMLAATAVASWSLAAKLQGVPDFATIADSVLTTAERTLTITVADAALTAGEAYVYVFYVT